MEKEEEGIRYKIHSGPKTPFRIGISILLFLLFTFGLVLLKPKSTPTGYAVSGNVSVNWLGLVLLVIPLILVLFWLKKRHSPKLIEKI